jgi:hypothetical protein
LYSRVAAALVAGAIFWLGVVPGRPAVLHAQSDLDAFMAKVLARRDENWKKLQQYILDERELVEIRGPGQVPIWGERRTYSWFIRDGYFVRSPLTVNGVTIGEDERRRFEDRYVERVKARERRDAERAKEAAKGQAAPDAPAPPSEMPTTMEGLLQQTRQPQFIDTAYFLKFKFEQGKYALVGRETVQERQTLRIEYYPARLFSHEQDDQQRREREKRRDRGEDVEAAMERMMNKVSLVTLWVDPATHQILKYTFDNVNLDFFPAAWLLRVNDLKASMTMSQPFKAATQPAAADIWLPRDVEIYFGAMLAIGAFDVRYRLDYHDYREATTSARIKREPAR